MPATNMTAMMRARRRQLQDYMYKGDAADVSAGDPESAAEDQSEPAGDNDASMTVLQPGDPDPEGQYVYEHGPGGAWMVYPPGVPCDTNKVRIALDHPADTEDFDQMKQMLAGGGAGASGAGGAKPDLTIDVSSGGKY